MQDKDSRKQCIHAITITSLSNFKVFLFVEMYCVVCYCEMRRTGETWVDFYGVLGYRIVSIKV